jgi:hypothetical protein
VNVLRSDIGRRALTVIAGVLLAACETVPTRPSVLVLPGSGKSLEQFQVDDIACRQWAGQQTGSETGSAGSEHYDIAYMQCMFAKGNRIPVRRGSPPPATSPTSPAAAPNPPAPPDVLPPPAGTPPPPPPGSGRSADPAP